MYGQSVKSKSHQGLELLNLSYCWLGQPKTQQFSWLVEKERFKSRIQNGFLWVVPRIQLDVHYIYLPCLLVSAKFQQPHSGSKAAGWSSLNVIHEHQSHFFQLPLRHCKCSPYNNLKWSGIHNLFYFHNDIFSVFFWPLKSYWIMKSGHYIPYQNGPLWFEKWGICE